MDIGVNETISPRPRGSPAKAASIKGPVDVYVYQLEPGCFAGLGLAPVAAQSGQVVHGSVNGVARVRRRRPAETGLAPGARVFPKSLHVKFTGARGLGNFEGVKGRNALAASSKIDARPGAHEVLSSGSGGGAQEQGVVLAACDAEVDALGIEE